MAASPNWKVYSAEGEYMGALKYPEDAAAMVAIMGEGGQVRSGHKLIVWREGEEEIRAGESYDRAAEIMEARSSHVMAEADRFIARSLEKICHIKYALKVVAKEADRDGKTEDIREIVDLLDEAKTIVDGWSYQDA